MGDSRHEPMANGAEHAVPAQDQTLRRVIRVAVERIGFLQAETSALRDVRAQLAAQEQAITGQHASAQREQTELLERLQRQHAQVRALESEIEAVRQETAAVERHEARTMQRIRAAGERVDVFEQDLGAAKDEIANARSALASGQDVISRLHRKLAGRDIAGPRRSRQRSA